MMKIALVQALMVASLARGAVADTVKERDLAPSAEKMLTGKGRRSKGDRKRNKALRWR